MASETENFHEIETISQDEGNSAEQNSNMMKNNVEIHPKAALNAASDEESESAIPTDIMDTDALTSTESSSTQQNRIDELNQPANDVPSEEITSVLTNGLANIALTQPDRNLTQTPSPIAPLSVHLPRNFHPASWRYAAASRDYSDLNIEDIVSNIIVKITNSNILQEDDKAAPTTLAAPTDSPIDDSPKTTIPTTGSEPDRSSSRSFENVLEKMDRETYSSDDEDAKLNQTTDDEANTENDPGSNPSPDTQQHTVGEAEVVQKACDLCGGIYPIDEIVSMLKCTHTCCLECAREYFTQEITNRSITNCNCPYCKEPNLNGPDVTEDDVLEYFSNMDILLRSLLDETVHDLFQRKLRDHTLSQDPNFKWCVQCSSGFFTLPKQEVLSCPDCGSITCASCRKPWESQHEGLSCEKYAEWKEANNPELQAVGVQRHLQQHGICCPNCKFRFELVRGGCMHFTCTQCKFEFCCGCNKPFMMGAKCSVSSSCFNLGLHAHHPRNCMFYLRDKEPWELQNLLKVNNVPFVTEPTGTSYILKCPTPLLHSICSAEVSPGQAGLCRTHYVEYLAVTVTKAQIDPLPIMDLNDCVQELRRRGKPLPLRGAYDTDPIYREMCQKVIKSQIPLNC